MIVSALNPALLEVSKTALEQNENTVRWYCTRCYPPLRATVGPA